MKVKERLMGKMIFLASDKESLVVSDWHLQPNDSLQEIWTQLIQPALDADKNVIFNGDIFDLVFWPLKCYKNGQAKSDFIKLIGSKQVYMVVGNHEGKEAWVRQLFDGNKNIIIGTSCKLSTEKREWWIEHGDRYCIAWGFLRPIYQIVAEIFLTINPKLWLEICRWAGWMPSAFKYRGETDKYNAAILVNWGNALLHMKHMKENGVVIGHTHFACCIDLAGELQFADCGDLRDRTGIAIDRNGHATKI